MNETPFRWAVGIIWSLAFLVGIPHRLRAARGGRVSRLGEGWFILIGLRLTAIAVLISLILWLINPGLVQFAQIPLPPLVRWAGLPLALGASAWVFWMFQTLGPNLTDTVAVRPTATLVTNGPYRYVRHPLYLGLAAVFLAMFLLTANLLVLAGGVIVLAFIVARTTIEERNLEERFGESYRAYCARTGKYWPRLSRPDPSHT
jgi:protein-S-isoprenylcysteine O-methyltransferase Ste14